jgi:glycosyltransferase involved in cell wall biosynthesis
MKILQLGKFYDPVVGGMETVLKELCESVQSHVQLQVLVANTRFRTDRENRGFQLTRAASLGTLFSCSMAPSFPLRVRKMDADLIQVHLPNPLAEMSSLLVSKDIPIIAHFHSDIVRQRNLLKLYQPFLEAFYRRVSNIIVPTPRHIDVSPFVSRYRDKCRVVPFGIPLRHFDLDKAGQARADKLREGGPTILCVGRLVSYKGLEFLIQAMADLPARLRIVGTGPLEHSLIDLARKRGLSDKIEFLGQLPFDELLAHYHACDVFVLPSVTNAEMFGVVQLEAMACRKPVISTTLKTGVSWVNQHDITGYLVPPGSVGDLASSIDYLLRNPKLREDMGMAGRQRVERHFTSEKMAAAMLEVYRDVARQTHVVEIPAEIAAPRPQPEYYEPAERAG